MNKLTRISRRTLLFAVLAASAIVPANAVAAPSLGIQVTRDQATIDRGDELVSYGVQVTNTSPTDPTTAPTSVSISFPPGVEMLTDSGSSTDPNTWLCDSSADTCTFGAARAPGAFPLLKVSAWITPDVLSDVVSAEFTASGGGASSVSTGDTFTLGPEVPFAFESLSARVTDQGGADDTQAGGHPHEARASFRLTGHTTTDAAGVAERTPESLRDFVVELPPGFIGNPAAIKTICTIQQVGDAVCPETATAGGAYVEFFDDPGIASPVPIYRITTPKGFPIALGFRPVPISAAVYILRPKPRADGDYGISTLTPLAPQAPGIRGINFATLCTYGADAEPSPYGGFQGLFLGCKDPGDSGAHEIPFLTNATECSGADPVTRLRAASYEHPGDLGPDGLPDISDPDWKLRETTTPAITGCNQLEFEPSFEGRPTTNVADAPSGLDFRLSIPQDGLLDPNGLAPAHLKKAKVVLPEGMTINPSAASGLAACSAAQIGLKEVNGQAPFPIRFGTAPAVCPDGSRLGSAVVTSPIIDQSLTGGLYLATQDDPATTAPGAENPFDSLLALYLLVENEDLGLRIKLAGRVDADPVTGRLTTTFDPNPQLPFDVLDLEIFKGPRAPLRTPPTCGPQATEAEFTPWSAPESGPPANLSDSFAISASPTGGACPSTAAEMPNAPRFNAGTVNPKAGAYSPFVLRLSRADGSQEIQGLEASLPQGLTARLAGVPYCSDDAIAAARDRDQPGDGRKELASPSCPTASEVGTVEVSAGAGPSPFRTSGRAFLAGPYKGAPISLVVITPAVAGPFDLGSVVIRNALHVDPRTAQVSVKSDPIPTILHGIPIDLRSLEVSVARPNFTLNPTSCEPMSVGTSVAGKSSLATLTDRFQVGECSSLGFKPRLSLRLKGKTKRTGNPRLIATVTPRPGDANIGYTQVTMPRSMFLEQAHIKTVCTRVQFAADQCPPGSVYGRATAQTPLLDSPLSGLVYLRSSNNKLPDLIADLRGPAGQPIRVELAGRTDSEKGALRNTFDLVPDAPVSSFRLELLGGDRGLIVNSRNLCKGTQRAKVRMRGQNGRTHFSNPVVKTDCNKKKRKAKKG